MVKSWQKLQGEAKPGLMNSVAGANAIHNDWLELLSIRNAYTKQIIFERLTTDERDAFRERAAMCEYEAGMDRDAAEWEALTHIVHKRLFHGRTF